MEVRAYNIPEGERYHPYAPEKPPATLKKVVPLVISFVAGTGGAVTAQSTEVMGRWVHDTAPHVHICQSSKDTKSLHEADSHTPSEHLARIREIFSFNISELADVLGISRPTAYKWLEGQEPSKQESIIEIRKLSEITDRLDELNNKSLSKLIRRPIFGSQSFLDKLKAKEDITEALNNLEKLSLKETTARREKKSSGRNRKSFSETAKRYSTTGYNQG
ncbi:MAG: hypothetical protein KZQ82_14815 [Candidatus Thiodiazotropha sp. (ex Lucinoma annulata)]|nr:hypothetical protein [Candidatus Thiodiazotropha sp. (ex Lucinoma annulata)]